MGLKRPSFYCLIHFYKRIMFLLQIIISAVGLASANVFTDPAVFERLCHFKNDGVVNHLNPVDEAMIADASCRLVAGDFDGYSLWKNRPASQAIIEALKELPPTGKPSHFVLTAQEQLPALCPQEAGPADEEAQCGGSLYETNVMAGAMHNWHRALCSTSEEAEWGGEFDPAYQPQQAALTAGFMCIIACDCNKNDLPASELARLAESPESAELARVELCSSLPWDAAYWDEAANNVQTLADLASPIMAVCGC